MTDSDNDDVVHTQALTQQVNVSAIQADIDNMQYDDDDSIQDDNSDSGAPVQPFSLQAADEQHDADDPDGQHSSNIAADAELHDDGSAEQPHIDADNQPSPSTAPTATDGKLKRPPSAYFLFCADKRAEVKAELTGQSVTAVAKALGERWKQLTPQQKQQYELTARTAKQHYAQLLLHNSSAQPASVEQPVDPLALVLPLAHIKRILHRDPAHGRLTKQAALALSYAVQLFVSDLSRRCWLRVRGGGGGGKRRVVRMEEVVAVVEGGVGLEWLRGEMRRMAKDMDKVREADKKKRDEEREKNKENEAAAADSTGDVQQSTEADKENREVADEADAEAGSHKEAAEQGGKVSSEGGKKKRKAGKAPIDTKQYKSLTSMFSRMQEVQQQKQQKVRQLTTVEEQQDEVAEIAVDNGVQGDEDDVLVDKRQRTMERSEMGVEELSDVEEEQRGEEEQDRVEREEVEMEELEVVTVSQRSKRRTAILDDDDDIDSDV